MNQINNAQTTLLTRTEAAAFLRMEPATLANWAWNQQHELPLMKIGRRVAYRLADLETFIAPNLVGLAA